MVPSTQWVPRKHGKRRDGGEEGERKKKELRVVLPEQQEAIRVPFIRAGEDAWWGAG